MKPIPKKHLPRRLVATVATLLVLSRAFVPSGAEADTQAASCAATGATLTEAKANFADTCDEPRVDCDPVDGLWECSSEAIGTGAPGQGSSDTPEPSDDPGSRGDACTATGATLPEAKANFADTCDEPRTDCDPVDGLWECSSEAIGGGAPGDGGPDPAPPTPDPTPVPPTPAPNPPTSGAFVEAGGLLTIEATSLDVPGAWRQFPSEAGSDPVRSGATGNSYIQWGGQDSFTQPGNGTISIPIVITTPGKYRFIWNSAVGQGNDGTEHNDSWLRIDSDSFAGERSSDGSVVCPVGTPASNRCDGDNPEGSSADGWFKIYRSGNPSAGFAWQARTSDNDAHDIFAEFDTAGTYFIEVSGRSESHAIDRIVLYRDGNDGGNVNIGAATDLNNPESERQ